MNFENMTQENINKMSPAMKLRLAYFKLQKEKAEKDQQQEVAKQEKKQKEEYVSEKEYHDAIYKLEKTRRELEKQLKQEEKDSLSD